jgi:hypothetical protein
VLVAFLRSVIGGFGKAVGSENKTGRLG